MRSQRTANQSPLSAWRTSRKYKEKEETAWFRITVFGAQAESCNQYLKKGSKVLVEGRLNPDTNGSPKVFRRKTAPTAPAMK
jgi:single-stranded DNA-binding protein